MKERSLARKLIGPVNRIILGLEELRTLTLEAAISDGLDDAKQLELVHAAKVYREFKQMIETLKEAIVQELDEEEYDANSPRTN
jgi:hypothetical protein